MKLSCLLLQDLIYKEFFMQGDMEKTMGTCPVESMDRDKAYIPTLQIQFLDNIVIPLYGCVFYIH
jgi:cGMP-dependent 3',5'-cyclic phosphodiesterase